MPPLSSATVTPTQTLPGHDGDNLAEHNKTEDIDDPCDFDYDDYLKDTKENSSTDAREKPPLRIVWFNVIHFAFFYVASHAACRMSTSAMWQTNLFAFLLYLATILGVTAGAHRLWSHRSYKARLPLRILLSLMFTTSYQNHIYEWSRDHRVHHKFSETSADPYDASRGFFFAHVGWLMCRKHPDVFRKGKTVDMSDLMSDPVVRFNRKYYGPLVLLCGFVFPTAIPMYFWNETFWNSLLIPTLFRVCITQNVTWLVNSAAHRWGNRPYDVHINPGENALANFFSIGEGFHNYHHTFPYDYSTSEWGIKYNLTTAFINLMAFLGLAYDLKTASRSSIEARKLRTGPESVKRPVANGKASVKEG